MDYQPQKSVISTDATVPPRPRLLDEVRRRIRVKHYSLRTERVYIAWIRRFILANGKRHPRDLGQAEIEAFLSHLAVEGQVSASTQNQALAALLFLYREVMLPVSRRSIPMRQILRGEAQAAFKAWHAKTDKVAY